MSGEPQAWRTFGEREVYRAPELWLGQVDVELPGGRRIWEDVVRLHRSASMALLDEQGRVLLVQTHRFVTGKPGWELPGGLVDEDESPADAAVRELEDTAGYRPRRVEQLIAFRPMAEKVDAEHFVFVGHELEKAGPTEAVRVEWVPLGSVAGLIADGKVWSGPSLVALLRLLTMDGRPLAAEGSCHDGRMRLLVLGGTRFVGWAVVDEAVSRGWEVTAFNRGVSGQDHPGVRALRGDRTRAEDVARLAGAGPWDAVVDTSGYVPREVLSLCERLEPVAGRCVFMSTVSVYRGWPVEPLSERSEVLYCPPDAGPEYGEDVEDGPTRYGYQKSGCELAVREAFGAERAVSLRPGVVLGPREYVGRLPWWLRRVAAGGRVLAPGSPGRSIQPVDVRDLALFALAAAENGLHGAYNVAAPIGRETFGGLLQACTDVTGSGAEFVWVPDERLLAAGVRQWSEMPLWRSFPGVWQVDSSAALAVGLSCRPLAATVADTWAWLQTSGAALEDERASEIGIGPERERQILGSLA